MLKINKLISTSAVDHAAEELKKYLRMMMPECGDIRISYSPEAEDGFRLGLMQDIGLDVSDAKDTELDDILYIDCDTEGGIIAGSNPRSVLLAVYEYLRQNGCRWLMPGVDGEYIPMQDIKPVKYRHKPSMRYRGWCNEGAEYQQCMIDAIDFAPKVGMNVFMMEFRIPTSYYNRYYNHQHNDDNRPAEPVTFDTILQWKRQCEAEIAKRGLQFHDIGHGWCTDPFGIDSSVRNAKGANDAALTEKQRSFLALVNGERKLVNDTPNYTNFCMSNPEAQRLFVSYVADYAENHTNADFLHVWLGDVLNAHCECDDCKKKIPSDWYVILLNMLDEELTRRNLKTRIVFIMYVDTLWAPLAEKLNSSDRFTLLFAPISRKYTESIPEKHKYVGTDPFVLNKLKTPSSLDGVFSFLDDWQSAFWQGSNIAYEYHFWRHQYYDPSGLKLSRIINADVKGYLSNGVDGIIQDGSQRSFFPNGFAFYTYARTMFDKSLTYDQLAEDYFSHAYGDGWRDIYTYLEKLSNVFDASYASGHNSADPNVNPYYNPEVAKQMNGIESVLTEGESVCRAHYNSDYRVQTVSVRLLEFHIEYCRLLANALIKKACGDDVGASEAQNVLRRETGKREVEFQPYFDHTLIMYSFSNLFATRSKGEVQIYRLDN